MVIEKVSFVDSLRESGSVVVGVYADTSLSPNAAAIDEKFHGIISKNLKKVSFSGKLFEFAHFIATDGNINHFIIIGLGDVDRKFTEFELEKLGAKIYDGIVELDVDATVAINAQDIDFPCGCASSLLGFGILLKSWHFDKYKSEKNEKIKLRNVSFLTQDTKKASECFSELQKLADGIFLTRQVVSEPANVIYPESLAKIAREELSSLGVEVEILGRSSMRELGMNALLGVAQGSSLEPQLVVLHWKGGNDTERPIAFVGKGVTFDSGGISIKPGDGMHEMRQDMAGSGTVLGLLKAIAANKLPVNVVGLMALVENMPSGTAQRPGDIVKSMSGQTIEVLNTDAEGRLVLADALWYAQDRFSPRIMIDLATLTGAIVVALGHEFAGLFSNSDALANQIIRSSEKTGEKVWRMPLTEHFNRGINSEIADMQNIAKSNIRAGSITAAQFLKRFVNNVDWAHLDIAGVDSTSDDLFICAKGATGFGVHLLYEFLKGNYANKRCG
ncbi:MAG: leucyl aminopeptidase [Holosporaceae bacterium]|jgi:leucyl aminopeptidase|nr:leucyl aminopeptidase [Holosporaceae bacterium]